MDDNHHDASWLAAREGCWGGQVQVQKLRNEAAHPFLLCRPNEHLSKSKPLGMNAYGEQAARIVCTDCLSARGTHSESGSPGQKHRAGRWPPLPLLPQFASLLGIRQGIWEGPQQHVEVSQEMAPQRGTELCNEHLPGRLPLHPAPPSVLAIADCPRVCQLVEQPASDSVDERDIHHCHKMSPALRHLLPAAPCDLAQQRICPKELTLPRTHGNNDTVLYCTYKRSTLFSRLSSVSHTANVCFRRARRCLIAPMQLPMLRA